MCHVTVSFLLECLCCVTVFVTDSLHTLSGSIGKVIASHAEGWKIVSDLWLSFTDLYHARGAPGALPMRVGGATSQLDLLSLTPLSAAGYGRVPLGHFGNYCK